MLGYVREANDEAVKRSLERARKESELEAARREMGYAAVAWTNAVEAVATSTPEAAMLVSAARNKFLSAGAAYAKLVKEFGS
jgi:hypothetical protein